MKDKLDKSKNQNQDNLEELTNTELDIVYGGITDSDLAACIALRDEENPYDGKKPRPNK